MFYFYYIYYCMRIYVRFQWKFYGGFFVLLCIIRRRGVWMEKKLIYKMIEDALKPYVTGVEEWEIEAEDFETMYGRVMERKNAVPEHEIYELVEDVVYEYITNDANV